VPPIVRQLLENQQAATMIEYSLIVALIATAAVSAMGTVGTGIRSVLSAVTVAMN
jgi:Flp pilus assembly pilin Flp